MTLCERCRRAEAAVVLSYQARCRTLEKRLCDPCSRAVDLPTPYTLKPLRSDRKKQPAPDP